MNHKISFIPNTKTEAEYDSFSHYCEFHHLYESDFDNIFNQNYFNPFLHQNNEKIKTIAHELSHFFDHVGTLYGQKLIIKQAEALHAWQSQDESSFYKIKEYTNLMYSLSFSHYYTQHFKTLRRNGRTQDIWGWHSSTGLCFTNDGHQNSNKPILFINFLDPVNQERISRVPFSTFSFWELNAINIELGYDAIHINQFPIKRNHWLNESLDSIYNQDLVIYSAGAHLYSNITGNPNIIDCYQSASRIATFLMNLPDTLLQQIPTIDFSTPEAQERARVFKENYDLSYLFYSLVHFVAKQGIDLSNEIGLNKLISNLGFEDYTRILSESSLQMVSNYNYLEPYDPTGHFRNLIMNVGLNALTARGLFSEKPINPIFEFPYWMNPLLIFKDTDFFNFDQSDQDKLDLLSFMYDKFILFHNICRV